MKKVYIAAPFFNPAQLAAVESIEQLCGTINGLQYYSPRSDGVLMEMTPEERKASMQRIFDTNVNRMNECDGMIAILDEKDTGTTWELGYAYMRSRTTSPRYRVMGYTSTPDVTINVMLAKGMHSHAVGLQEAREMLEAFASGQNWMTRSAYGDTY